MIKIMGKDDFGINGNTNVWPMLGYQKKLKESRHLSSSGCQSKVGDSVWFFSP